MTSNSYSGRWSEPTDLAVIGAILTTVFLLFPYTGCGARGLQRPAGKALPNEPWSENFFNGSTNSTSEKTFEWSTEEPGRLNDESPTVKAPELRDLFE
jgi:hypothetical protein